LGELAVGLTFGFALSLILEALMFAGQMIGMEFSFSLVNLMDPNSNIQTPVLGQLLNWMGLLVLIGAGLDRSLLAAVMHSFAVVPVGQAAMKATTGAGHCGGADSGDCSGVGGQDLSATAGDGSQHSAEDAGVVCGADRIARRVAGLD
jgi:flagellar biosynthetic protein FliR